MESSDFWIINDVISVVRTYVSHVISGSGNPHKRYPPLLSDSFHNRLKFEIQNPKAHKHSW